MPVPRFLAAVVCVSALILVTLAVAGASDALGNALPAASPAASPVAGGGERLDLAAMSLPSDVVPSGYTLGYRLYVPGDHVAGQLTAGKITPEEVAATGLRWYYESEYRSPDQRVRIRSYVEEYPSPDGARAGFRLFEDETRFTTKDSAFADHPAPSGIGEEPSETTTGVYQPTDGTPPLRLVDITFRLDRLLGGVAIEVAGGGRPDQTVATNLARKLEQRMRAVLDRTALPGIDGSLAHDLVPLDALGQSVQEGYVSAGEALGPAATSGALRGYQSGYLRTVALGYTEDPALPLPFITVAVSSFASEQGSLAVLTKADSVQPAFTALERVQIDRIPGSSAAVAYRFANPFTRGRTVDSFRILMTIGNKLITVDVQGAGTADGAQAAALVIAADQASCLFPSGSCIQPTKSALPPGLARVKGVTPTATPVG